MKLISCHISNFGKLHDADFSFTEGLNEITAGNGWGKSTLAAFIKVMFYGLSGDGKKDELVSERKRYSPWQGGTFGGVLVFEARGKRYSISRSFGAKAALDTFELRDADTNLVSTDFSDCPGEELFGINADSFARTVFIGQDTDVFSKTTDDINARLGNITDVMDLNRFANIDEKLKNDLNALSSTRKTGEVYKLKDEESELKAVLRAGAGTDAAADTVRERIEKTKAEISTQEEMKEGLTALRTVAAKREKIKADRVAYAALTEDVTVKEKAYRESLFNLDYGGCGNYSEDIELIAEDISKLSDLRLTMAGLKLSADEQDRLEGYESRISNPEETAAATEDASHRLIAAGAMKGELKSKEESLSQLVYERDNTLQNRKKAAGLAVFGAIALILGIGSVLVWVLLYDLLPIVIAGAGLFVLGIVLFIAYGVRSSALNREREIQSSRISKLESEIEGLSSEIEGAREFASNILEENGILFADNTAVADLKQLYSQCYDYSNLKKKLETFKAGDRTEECNALSVEISSLFGDFGLRPTESEYAAGLASLNRKREACSTASNLYNDAAARKAEFEKIHNMEELTGDDEETEYSLEDVAAMEAGVDEKIKALRDTLEIDRRQLSDFTERLESLEDTKDRLLSVSEAIKEKSELSEVLEDTRKFLNKAKESLTARYMGPLTEGFSKYFRMVTGSEGSEYMIDANTDITVVSDGLQHSAQLLSSGYKDLVGLCMRLALTDAMYKEEKPMLILDDPFVNFDSDNYRGGKNLLSKAGSEYQILYFTCRETGQNN